MSKTSMQAPNVIGRARGPRGFGGPVVKAKDKKETIKKTCQRTFQALRIDVNREFEVLYEFMEKLCYHLYIIRVTRTLSNWTYH